MWNWEVFNWSLFYYCNILDLTTNPVELEGNVFFCQHPRNVSMDCCASLWLQLCGYSAKPVGHFGKTWTSFCQKLCVFWLVFYGRMLVVYTMNRFRARKTLIIALICKRALTGVITLKANNSHNVGYCFFYQSLMLQIFRSWNFSFRSLACFSFTTDCIYSADKKNKKKRFSATF